MIISNVKESYRGVELVMFTVTFTKPQYTRNALSWLVNVFEILYSDELECKNPVIFDMAGNNLEFQFRFNIEPYSTQANAFYRYIDKFGKWLEYIENADLNTVQRRPVADNSNRKRDEEGLDVIGISKSEKRINSFFSRVRSKN